MKLGFDTGFDSGSTLDYVYRNQPSGKGKLGELIDRNYLNAIGWRGIRQRKLHVEELLREAIRRLREQQRPVHIVDIAAGHGRYILEALQEQMPDSILLRDYSELNVQQGSALIAEKGLTEVARFVQGDAFDRQSLASLDPHPTLAVVSGLYELFASNDRWAVPGGPGRCCSAGRLSCVHRPALAPATGDDRPCPHQPPRWPGLGNASAQPGGDGPVGGGGRLSQGRSAHR